MIPNSLFSSPKLKFTNLFMLVFMLTIGTSYSKNNEELPLNEYIFYSKEGNILAFSSDNTYFLLVKNNKSCMNCFVVLSDFLEILKAKEKTELIAITHSDSTPLARRRNIHESLTMFPNFNEHCVTYSQRWEESSPTPELLIIKNNKLYVFSYSEIFADGFDFISIEVQNKISKILTPK